MKKMIVTLAASIMAIAMASAGEAQERIKVGGIIYARDSQYWQQAERGMNDAAKKLGVDLQIGLNRRQLATEGQLIEDFATRGVNIIVMPPLDTQASGAAAQRVKSRNIMIVDYDTRFADSTISSHTIGVDSRELAGVVGKEMRKLIVASKSESAAAVGLITLPPTNPNMQARRGGVVSALEGANVAYVAEVAAATPEQGANAFENILQRNPATAMIWASNSGSLSGAAAAARRSNAKAKLYGIDMSQELAQMLLDPSSNLQAVSDQQPYLIGYTAVETAVKSFRGEKLARQINVPARLYTREDPKAVTEYLDFVKSLSN
ncbi:sugar ABC transporter substrate-binding protein [Microvirga sp. VF16]|uniref:sugar ABC transporter substrate-binding protein n=1 Tax=Microvirga sp. VF16 TaxID=2807101 RepID=UPI00193E6268|nr:sugar ABC transporter substrate-binding protein [Microvirga sp. VF16]QRM33967.1 sugar ABC transporter substrate-binding protein [Microvirga sp. VF16]